MLLRCFVAPVTSVCRRNLSPCLVNVQPRGRHQSHQCYWGTPQAWPVHKDVTRPNPATSHNSWRHKTEQWNITQLVTPQDRTVEHHTTRYTTRQNAGTSQNVLCHKTERLNITRLTTPQDRTLEHHTTRYATRQNTGTQQQHTTSVKDCYISEI